MILSRRSVWVGISLGAAGLVILFQQLTLHLAPSVSEPRVPELTAVFQPEFFYPARSAAADLQLDPFPHPVRVGVVPHHLLASPLIAQFFYQVQSGIETIVLIGPNHAGLGGAPVLTAQANWQTRIGAVGGETQAAVSKLPFAAEDTRVVQDEYAVSGMVPFVAQYLAQARVLPLVLSHELKTEELEQLAAVLSEYNPETTLVLAAVDFSHFGNAAAAAQRDQITLQLLRERRWNDLLRLSPDYTDCPDCLVLVQKVAQNWGIREFQVLQHASAADFQPAQDQEVTSYFVLGWFAE